MKGAMQEAPRSFWALVAAFYLLYISTGGLHSWFYPQFTALGQVWNTFAVYLTVAIVHALASIRIVKYDEIGAITLLGGKALFNLHAGIAIVPFAVCWLIRESRLVIEMELPADPEHIWRPAEDSKESYAPEGFYPPIRITFAEKSGSDDPLSERVTEEVIPVVRFKIENLCRFLRTIGTRMEAQRQMSDVAVAILSQHFTQKTLAEALQDIAGANKILKENLQKLVEGQHPTDDAWGINIDDALVKGFNLSRKLIQSFQAAA